MNPSVKIFAGTGSQALAEKIAQRFGAPIGKINIQKSFRKLCQSCLAQFAPQHRPRRNNW